MGKGKTLCFALLIISLFSPGEPPFLFLPPAGQVVLRSFSRRNSTTTTACGAWLPSFSHPLPPLSAARSLPLKFGMGSAAGPVALYYRAQYPLPLSDGETSACVCVREREESATIPRE